MTNSVGYNQEQGRLLFTQQCIFLQGVASISCLPNTNLTEIAFAGRSNVGKSSLINSLTGRKKLARTSNIPGRTQQINFFNLGEQLIIADLPGYGFARAPKVVVRSWTELVNSYLNSRTQLCRVFLLIDARHGIKDNDKVSMNLLDKAAVSYQIVFTKIDKIKKEFLNKIIAETLVKIKTQAAAHPDLLITSSTKGFGMDHLRTEIATLVAQRKLM